MSRYIQRMIFEAERGLYLDFTRECRNRNIPKAHQLRNLMTAWLIECEAERSSGLRRRPGGKKSKKEVF